MPEIPLPEVAGFQVFGRGRIWVFANSLGQSDVHVFDGNPPEVYARKHVPGAIHLDTEDIKKGVLPADKNSTLIFYCMSEL